MPLYTLSDHKVQKKTYKIGRRGNTLTLNLWWVGTEKALGSSEPTYLQKHLTEENRMLRAIQTRLDSFRAAESGHMRLRNEVCVECVFSVCVCMCVLCFVCYSVFSVCVCVCVFVDLSAFYAVFECLLLAILFFVCLIFLFFYILRFQVLL